MVALHMLHMKALLETENSYYFFGANQKASIKFFSWIQHDFSVKRRDWCILEDNKMMIARNCVNSCNCIDISAND